LAWFALAAALEPACVAFAAPARATFVLLVAVADRILLVSVDAVRLPTATLEAICRACVSAAVSSTQPALPDQPLSQQRLSLLAKFFSEALSALAFLRSPRRGEPLLAFTEHALLQHGAAAFAIPNIDKCLSCDRPLLVEAEPLCGRDKTIFYKPMQLASPGTLHLCKCACCSITYDIEGYYRTPDPCALQHLTSSTLKLPLPAQHRHPDFIRLSNLTVIHRDFAALYRGYLQTSAGSVHGLSQWHFHQVKTTSPAQAYEEAATKDGEPSRVQNTA
jgi:hypothetical protein